MKEDIEIDEIITWAENRNLIYGSSIKDETLKLMSQFGELSVKINERANCSLILGNMLITLIIICKMKKTSLQECLNHTKNLNDKRMTDAHYALMEMCNLIGGLAYGVTTSACVSATLGKLLIYLKVFAEIHNYSLRECLNLAYSKVEKNTELLFNGRLISNDDKQYIEANEVIQFNIRSRDK